MGVGARPSRTRSVSTQAAADLTSLITGQKAAALQVPRSSVANFKSARRHAGRLPRDPARSPACGTSSIVCSPLWRCRESATSGESSARASTGRGNFSHGNHGPAGLPRGRRSTAIDSPARHGHHPGDVGRLRCDVARAADPCSECPSARTKNSRRWRRSALIEQAGLTP